MSTELSARLNNCLAETDFPGTKYQGKVRDVYELAESLLLISTDRVSAFDRLLACIPCKGQVLNQISAWWFEQTKHIVPNHLLSMPDPNVVEVKKCEVFPIEVIVRGYITGTTNTSLWTMYNAGDRHLYGYDLPEGLTKNQRLPENIITPTTKDKEHDKPLTANDIVNEDHMDVADWQQVSAHALKLFAHGQTIAAENGLILADTKYEFGRDVDGNILLVDEIHTPDSSRYWLADTYQERLTAGLEPDNMDKEILRLWYREHCDPYNDAVLPQAPEALIIKLATSYIKLYEMLTKQQFDFSATDNSIALRLQQNLNGYF